MGQIETASGSGSKSLLNGWISRQDLAKELGLTIDTLGRWHRERFGPVCIKAGRKVFYRRHVVEAWLQAQENPLRKRSGGRK